MGKVLDAKVPPPSAYVEDIPPPLEAIILRGLDRDPAKRFQTAGEMATAIEDAVPMVAASRIGRWVEATATQRLAVRTERIAAMESNSAIRGPRPDPRPAAGAPPSNSMIPTTVASGVISAPQVISSPAVLAAGPAPRSRWAVVVALVAGLLTVGGLAAAVVVFVIAKRGPSVPVVTLSPAVPAIEPAVPPPAEASETPAASSPPPGASVETVPVTSLPAAAATGKPAAIPMTVPVGQLPVAAPPPASHHPHPAASAHSAVDCNPPYYYNAQGDRIFKKECL